MERRDWTWVLLLVALVGCGRDETRQTPFGSESAVRDYRESLERIIQEVNEIDLGWRERAVRTSGQASGENLAQVYDEFRPRLSAAIADLDRIEVPRRLDAMHADLRQALVWQLEAFDLVIEGWRVEQEQSSDEAQLHYEEAEKNLSEAGQLLASVNEVLVEVDIALAEAEGKNLVA